ncbi:MAG: malic enzyme-like NAD(P)-binding protein, partial [Candidatus Bathyarchaeia archaeon]
RIVEAAQWLEPTFGGVNLEDIAAPKCFYILEEARKRLSIPVWHDDQQGTATIILAGVINALKIVGKKIGEVQFSLIGAGAAIIMTAKILIKAGAKPGDIILVDRKGILSQSRKDLQEAAKKDDLVGRWKWEICQVTNDEMREGGVEEAMAGADFCIAASRPGPGVIKKEWVRRMADNPVVFACANPTPEIWPGEAKEAGAKIVATGRSDFPNQVNNSLVFPGVFRGVLDVRARTITDEMCLAAARELASFAEARGISPENIVPRMDEWLVYAKEAVACAQKAMEQDVARLKLTRNELEDRALSIIKSSRDIINLLAKK